MQTEHGFFLFCVKGCIMWLHCIHLTHLIPSFPPQNPALCQSAAWSQSCRRKSVPTTQEWTGFTSTKGYECVRNPPHPTPPHHHPNTAIAQLQARSSPLCQLSSFSVPKLSFTLLISTSPDGCLRTPLSLSASLL